MERRGEGGDTTCTPYLTIHHQYLLLQFKEGRREGEGVGGRDGNVYRDRMSNKRDLQWKLREKKIERDET